MTTLKTLILQNNQFGGPLPVALGDLTSLTILQVSNNLYTASIPTSFCNLTQLNTFDVARNQLNGTIPACFAHLNLMAYLSFQENQMTGPLPAAISNMTSLKTLSLGSGNHFTGSVARDFFSRLTNLMSLDISNLSGNITGFNIAHLPALQKLYTIFLDQRAFTFSLTVISYRNVQSMSSTVGNIDLFTLPALQILDDNSSPNITFDGSIACSRTWSSCSAIGTNIRVGLTSGALCKCSGISTYTMLPSVTTLTLLSATSSPNSADPASATTSSTASESAFPTSSVSTLTIQASSDIAQQTNEAGAVQNVPLTPVIAAVATAGGSLIIMGTLGAWLFYRRKMLRKKQLTLKSLQTSPNTLSAMVPNPRSTALTFKDYISETIFPMLQHPEVTQTINIDSVNTSTAMVSEVTFTPR
jgi:hypothetical protein